MAGDDLMETLCNRIVVPVRNEAETITSFKTAVGNPIQCVFTAGDVTCNTCQHVWRNIR
jgi:hypothetical protein